MRRGVEICKGIIIGLLLLSAALLAMTIIDLMAAIPKEADKDGNICV